MVFEFRVSDLGFFPALVGLAFLRFLSRSRGYGNKVQYTGFEFFSRNTLKRERSEIAAST